MSIFDSQEEHDAFLESIKASQEAERRAGLEDQRQQGWKDRRDYGQALHDYDGRREEGIRVGKEHMESWLPWELRAPLEGARAGTARALGGTRAFGLISDELAGGFMDSAQAYDRAVVSGMEQAGVSELRKGFNRLTFEAGKMVGQQTAGGLGLLPGIGPAIQTYNRLVGWGASSAVEMEQELRRTNPEMSESERWTAAKPVAFIEQGFMFATSALGRASRLKGFGGVEDFWAKGLNIPKTAAQIEKLAAPARLFRETFSKFTRDKGKRLFWGMTGETVEEVGTEVSTSLYRAVHIPGMEDHWNWVNEDYEEGDYRRITESKTFNVMQDVAWLTLGTMGLIQAPGVARSAMIDFLERPSRGNYKAVRNVLKELGIEENDSLTGRERAKFLYEKLREEGITTERLAQVAAAHGVSLTIDPDLGYTEGDALPEALASHGGYEVQPGVFLDPKTSEKTAATVENIERQLVALHNRIFGDKVEIRFYDTDGPTPAGMPNGQSQSAKDGRKAIVWVSRNYVKQYAAGDLGAFELRDLMGGVYMHEMHDAVYKSGMGSQLEQALKSHAPAEHEAAREDYKARVPGLTEAEYDREAVSMVIQNRIANGDSGWLQQMVGGDLPLFSRIRQWAYKRKNLLGKDSFHDLLFNMVRRVAETEGVEPVTVPPKPGSGASLVSQIVGSVVDAKVVDKETPKPVKAGRRAKRILDKYKDETPEESNERLADQVNEEVFFFDETSGEIKRGVLEDLLLDSPFASVSGERVSKNKIFSSVPRVSASTTEDAEASLEEMTDEQEELIADELEVPEGGDVAEAMVDEEITGRAQEAVDVEEAESEPTNPVDQPSHTGESDAEPNEEAVNSALNTHEESVRRGESPEPVDRTRGRAVSPNVTREVGGGALVPIAKDPDPDQNPEVGVIQDHDEVMTSPSTAAYALSDAIAEDREGIAPMSQAQRQEYADKFMMAKPGLKMDTTLADLALAQYLDGKGILTPENFAEAKRALESRTINPEYRDTLRELNELQLDYEILVRVSDRGRQEQALKGTRNDKVGTLVEEAAKRALYPPGTRRAVQLEDNQLEIENGVLRVETDAEFEASLLRRMFVAEDALKKKGYSEEQGIQNANLETMEFLVSRNIAAKHVMISDDGTLMISAESKYVSDKRVTSLGETDETLRVRARETMRTVKDIMAGISVGADNVPAQAKIDEAQEVEAKTNIPFEKLSPEEREEAGLIAAAADAGEPVGGRTVSQWYGGLKKWIKERVTEAEFFNGPLFDAISNAVRGREAGQDFDAFLGTHIRGRIKELTRAMADRARRERIDAGTTREDRQQRAADLRAQEATDEEIPTEDQLASQEAQNAQQAELEETVGGVDVSARRRHDEEGAKPNKKHVRVVKKVAAAIGNLRDPEGNSLYTLGSLGATRNDAGTLNFDLAALEENANQIQAVLQAAGEKANDQSIKDAAKAIRDQFDAPAEGWMQSRMILNQQDVPIVAAQEQAVADVEEVNSVAQEDRDTPELESKPLREVGDIDTTKFYRIKGDKSGEVIHFQSRVDLEVKRGSVQVRGDAFVIIEDDATGEWHIQRDAKVNTLFDVRELELVPESELPVGERSENFVRKPAPATKPEDLREQKKESSDRQSGRAPAITPERRVVAARNKEARLLAEIEAMAPGLDPGYLVQDLTIADLDANGEKQLSQLLDDLFKVQGTIAGHQRRADEAAGETQSPGAKAGQERKIGKIRSFVRALIGRTEAGKDSLKRRAGLDPEPVVVAEGETLSPGAGRLRFNLFSGSPKLAELLPISRRKQAKALGAGIKHEERSKTGFPLDPKLEAGLPLEDEPDVADEVSLALNEALGRDGLGMAPTTEERLVNLATQITMVQEGPELRKMREEKPRELARIVDWLWEVEDMPFVPRYGDARTWRGGAVDFMPREVATIKLGLVTGKWPPLWAKVVDQRRKRFTARTVAATETLSPGSGPLDLIKDEYEVTRRDEWRAPHDTGKGLFPPAGEVTRRVIIKRKDRKIADLADVIDRSRGDDWLLHKSGQIDFAAILGVDLREVAHRVMRHLSQSVYKLAADKNIVPAGQEAAYARRAAGETYAEMSARVLYEDGKLVPIAEAFELANDPESNWDFEQSRKYRGMLDRLDSTKGREDINREAVKHVRENSEKLDLDVGEIKRQVELTEAKIRQKAVEKLETFSNKWKDGVIVYDKAAVLEDAQAAAADLATILAEKGPDARNLGWDPALSVGIRELLGSMTRAVLAPTLTDPVSGKVTGGETSEELVWDEFDPDNFQVEKWLQFNAILTTFLVDTVSKEQLTNPLILQTSIRKTFRVYSLLREAKNPAERKKIIEEHVGIRQKRTKRVDEGGEFETVVGEEFVTVPTQASRTLANVFGARDADPGYAMLQLNFSDALSSEDFNKLSEATSDWGGKIPSDLTFNQFLEVYRQDTPLKRGSELAVLMDPDGRKEGGELWAGVFSLMYGNASLLGDPANNFAQLSFMRQMGMLGDLNEMGVTHRGATELTDVKQAQQRGRQSDIDKGFFGPPDKRGKFKSAAVRTYEFLVGGPLDQNDAQKVEGIFGDTGYKEATLAKAAAILNGKGSYNLTFAEAQLILRGREELVYFRLGADTGRGLVAINLDNITGHFDAVARQFELSQKDGYVDAFQDDLDAVKDTGQTGWETEAPVLQSINQEVWETLSPGSGEVGAKRGKGGRRTTPAAFSGESQKRYEALRAQARSYAERQEDDKRRHSDERVRSDADRKIARVGWKGIIKEAVEVARRGNRENFNDVDQVALTLTINGLTASQKQNPKNLEMISLAITAAQSITTEFARGLRAAGTVMTEEDQRLATMHKAVFTPERSLHHKLERLRESGDTIGAEALQKEWINGTGRYAGKGLPALHKYLRTMGVDPLALEKMKNDPFYANKVLNLAGQHKADLMDGASEWFRNSILGALTTQAANIAGSIPYFMWEVGVKRNLEALVNLAVQDPNLPTFAENAVIFKHMIKNVSAGARMGVMAFKHEAPVVEAMLGYEGRRGGSSKVEGLRTSIKGKFGKAVRVPQNVLLAMDEWMKWTMSNGFAAGYAFRIARSAVKKGVIKPADSAMMMDRLLNDKDKLVFTPAMNESLRLLWQTPLGATGQKIIQLRDTYRPLRFIMPFVVTPINIFKTGVRMSPLGSANLLLKAAQARSEGKSIAETWTKLSPEVIEQGISWMMMYALMGTGDEDDPEAEWITGSAQEWEAGPRQASRREGMPPPFSVKIGNTWASYERIEPFATVLSTLVDMAQAVKAGDVETIAGNTAKSLYGQMYNKTFTRSFADMVDAAHNWRERGFYSGAGHWATNFATAWVPNYVRSAGRALQREMPERGLWGDDAEVKARTFDRLLAKTELGLVDNTPKVDIWGRNIDRTNIHNPVSSFMYQLAIPVRIKQTDAFVGDRVLLKWNAKHAESPKAKYPRAPKKSMQYEGKTMTFSDSQYHEYAKLAGQVAKQLVATVNLNVDNPTETDIDLILNSITRAKAVAREILGPKFFGKGLVRADYTITDIAEEIRDRQIKSFTNKLAEKPPTWKKLDEDQNKLPKERRAAILQRLEDELEEQKTSAFEKLDQLGIDVPTALQRYGGGKTGRRRIAVAMHGRT